MKMHPSHPSRFIKLICLTPGTTALMLALLTSAGCGKVPHTATTKTKDARIIAEPFRLVLLLLGGDSALDLKISRAQEKVRTAADPAPALEQLGWLFVAKARASFDPGFYKLAEQCSFALEEKKPHAPEALLLRGHVWQSLHRFKDAEPLARELATTRGRAFDYGLLGDVLMEQGRLDEAVEAYQKMADIKPDLHAYTRAAHVRWLKGDLEGALEMMQLAAHAASPNDAESAAWVYAHLAQYQLQAGDLAGSLRDCEAACAFQTNYPPALLVRGKIQLHQGKTADAVTSLTLAAAANPLPEYQWTLLEALHAAGRPAEAASVESSLNERGAANDPRTFAVYSATLGHRIETALHLAQAELETRRDVFTYDAVAWSLAAAGRWHEADANVQRALAEGTQDARLFLHAGIIAAKTDQPTLAEKHLRAAAVLDQMLLPSEKARLHDCADRLGLDLATPVVAAPKDFSEQRTLFPNEKTENNQTTGVSSL